MQTEDGSIIQQCLNGDPSAFGMLVDKYKAGIYAFVYDKLRDFQDAQDVTQKVFVKAYLSLRRLRNWESFTFWLYRIARNLCKDWIRDQSRRPDREFIEDQDPEILEVYSLNLYRENQMYEPLQEALDSLPDSYREALLLHYFGGMTIKDMARSLSASPTAIGMRLSRARAHLREEMVTTMESTFRGQKLRSTFTFRVVEAVKQIKVPPMPRMAGLPWGLSLAVGVIITVLSLNPHMSIPSDMAIPTGSPLPAEMRVLKTGEIPVDILDTSWMLVIASKRADGDDGGELQDPQNLALMVAHGQENTWLPKADMPTARFSLSTSSVDGKVYAIGGYNGWQTCSVTETYDPKEDIWTRKANMPAPRSRFSTGVVDGKIYAIGGGAAQATVEEYDPVKDKWTRKANIPTPRTEFGVGVVDGKIYAIGGWNGVAEDAFSTVEMYDPETDTWAKKADMPAPRCRFSASVVDGKIYAISGCDRNHRLVPTVEEYDPATDTWTKKAQIPTPRILFSASVVNKKIYAIGGTSQGWGEVPFAAVEEYDPVADEWVKKAAMPTPRCAFSTSAVDGKVYAIGGWLQGNITTAIVEVYDTGFTPKSMEAKGKLSTKWGELKSD